MNQTGACLQTDKWKYLNLKRKKESRFLTAKTDLNERKLFLKGAKTSIVMLFNTVIVCYYFVFIHFKSKVLYCSFLCRVRCTLNKFEVFSVCVHCKKKEKKRNWWSL